MMLKKRWTAKRKAELINAIGRGDVSMVVALEDNKISYDEFSNWLTRMTVHGFNGLKATKIQQMRTPHAA